MCTLDEVRKAIAGKDDKELVKSLVELNKRERATSADILLHLIEVEQRKLHLEYGYSSLFSYACKELHYSEPAAHRRTSSARCIERIPELYPMLLAGEVSLTTISLVSKVITPENKAELLAKLRGASRSDVEKLLASMQGTGREIRDRIKPVAGKAVARQGVTAAESQGSLGQVAKETEKGIQESTEQGTEQSTARTSAGGGFDTGNPLQQSDTETQRYEIRCAVSAEVRDKLCLLYTSPSPRDWTISRMPSSA